MQSLCARLVAAVIVLACPVLGQIMPGHSIVTVIPTGQPGEMYDVDHQAGTATQLTIGSALSSGGPNSVLMTSAVTGYVGTNATGNVYLIVVAGGTVTETLLNTTPTAGVNVAELTIVGSRLYFTTQNAGVVGVLQSVPLAGGPVSMDLDLATVGATGLANAVTSIGTKVYVATFNSSPANTATSPGELVEYDTLTGTGRLVRTLPPGGFTPVGNPWNMGVINMRADPQRPGNVVLLGVYGDMMSIDPATATVTSHVWTGLLNAGGNALASGSVNSGWYDPVADDWIIGTRYASIERWVGNQQAELQITGIGTHPTPGSNSLTGLYYFPFASGVDVSIGSGCPGNGGWTPTDSSFGAPNPGNSAFRLGLFSANPGDAAILALDFQNAVAGPFGLPLDLGNMGAPGCVLRSGTAFVLFVITSGSGPGGGQATVPVPVPIGASGLTVYRQWASCR